MRVPSTRRRYVRISNKDNDDDVYDKDDGDIKPSKTIAIRKSSKK